MAGFLAERYAEEKNNKQQKRRRLPPLPPKKNEDENGFGAGVASGMTSVYSGYTGGMNALMGEHDTNQKPIGIFGMQDPADIMTAKQEMKPAQEGFAKLEAEYAPSRNWSSEDIFNDPMGYITSPSGLRYSIGNQVGFMAGSAPVGGLGGGMAKIGLNAVGKNAAKGALTNTMAGKGLNKVVDLANTKAGTGAIVGAGQGSAEAIIEGGLVYRDLIAQGKSPEEASAIALEVAAKNIPTSVASGAAMGGVWGRAAERFANPTTGSRVLNTGKALLFGAPMAATPDALQEVVQEGITGQAKGEKVFDIYSPETWNNPLSPEQKSAALQGFIGSAVLGGVPSAVGAGVRRPRPRVEEQKEKPVLKANTTSGNEEIDRIIEEKSKQYGIDPNLVHAVIQQESGYRTKVKSSAGAVGLMQLMEGTAKDLGVTDRTDPEQNIDGGIRYLKQMYEKNGGDWNNQNSETWEAALASYNGGYGNRNATQTRLYAHDVWGKYNKIKGENAETDTQTDVEAEEMPYVDEEEVKNSAIDFAKYKLDKDGEDYSFLNSAIHRNDADAIMEKYSPEEIQDWADTQTINDVKLNERYQASRDNNIKTILENGSIKIKDRQMLPFYRQNEPFRGGSIKKVTGGYVYTPPKDFLSRADVGRVAEENGITEMAQTPQQAEQTKQDEMWGTKNDTLEQQLAKAHKRDEQKQLDEWAKEYEAEEEAVNKWVAEEETKEREQAAKQQAEAAERQSLMQRLADAVNNRSAEIGREDVRKLLQILSSPEVAENAAANDRELARQMAEGRSKADQERRKNAYRQAQADKKAAQSQAKQQERERLNQRLTDAVAGILENERGALLNDIAEGRERVEHQRLVGMIVDDINKRVKEAQQRREDADAKKQVASQTEVGQDNSTENQDAYTEPQSSEQTEGTDGAEEVKETAEESTEVDKKDEVVSKEETTSEEQTADATEASEVTEEKAEALDKVSEDKGFLKRLGKNDRALLADLKEKFGEDWLSGMREVQEAYTKECNDLVEKYALRMRDYVLTFKKGDWVIPWWKKRTEWKNEGKSQSEIEEKLLVGMRHEAAHRLKKRPIDSLLGKPFIGEESCAKFVEMEAVLIGYANIQAQANKYNELQSKGKTSVDIAKTDIQRETEDAETQQRTSGRSKEKIRGDNPSGRTSGQKAPKPQVKYTFVIDAEGKDFSELKDALPKQGQVEKSLQRFENPARFEVQYYNSLQKPDHNRITKLGFKPKDEKSAFDEASAKQFPLINTHNERLADFFMTVREWCDKLDKKKGKGKYKKKGTKEGEGIGTLKDILGAKSQWFASDGNNSPEQFMDFYELAVAKNYDLPKKWQKLYEDCKVGREDRIPATERGDITRTDAIEFNLETDDEVSREYRHDVMRGKGFGEEEIADLDKRIEKVAKIVKEVGDLHKDFGDWQRVMTERLQEKGILVPKVNAFIKNGEYQLNMDLGTLCIKREGADAAIQVLVDKGEVQHLGASQIWQINDVLKKNGYLVPCEVCFVESKRVRALDTANSISLHWKAVLDALGIKDGKKIGEERTLTAEQQARLDRMARTSSKDKEIREAAFNELVADKYKRGYDKDGTVMDNGLTPDKMARIASLMKQDSRLIGEFDAGNIMTSANTDKLLSDYHNTGLAGFLASADGAATAKPLQGRHVYDGLSFKTVYDKSKKTPAYVFDIGGVRLQSFSDFDVMLFFDYVQFIADLEARGLPAHTYTKIPEFVEFFKKTGIKTNMSLLYGISNEVDANGNKPPAGLQFAKDENGNIKYDRKGNPKYDYLYADESFGAKQGVSGEEGAKRAFSLRDKEGNVGTIAVGLSDEHIEKALEDDRIDMVIPYHASGMPKSIQIRSGLVGATDYSKQQNTKKKKKSADKKQSANEDAESADKDKVEKEYPFNKKLREFGDPVKTANDYLKWCAEHEYTPKFPKFAKPDSNYYKLLVDFRVYDSKGEYAPQKSVQLKLPRNTKKLLKGRVAERVSNVEKVKEIKQNEALVKELKDTVTRYERIDGIALKEMEKRLNKVLGTGKGDAVVSLRSAEFFDELDKLAEQNKGITKQQVEVLRTSNKVVYGFAVGGKIYLNENYINANTPAHEFTHVWAKVVKDTKPKLWKQGVNLLKADPRAKKIWDEVMNDPNYESIHNNEDAVASEVLSRIVGGENEKLVRELFNNANDKRATHTKSFGEKLMKWIESFFKNVIDILDLDRDVKYEDFVNAPLGAIWDEQAGKSFNEALRKWQKMKDKDGLAEMSMEDDLSGAKFQIAYHGTPHIFDEFSLSSIGSGEGAQAHGWGLYFAQNDAVAEEYRDRLAQKQNTFGMTFEVDIPDSDVLLDEQKYFNEQPQKAQEAIRKLYSDTLSYRIEVQKRGDRTFYLVKQGDGVVGINETMEDAQENIKILSKQEPHFLNKDGASIYTDISYKMGSRKAASETLNEYGIKGITYEGGRDGRCFVIFDDKAIEIKRQYDTAIKENKAEIKRTFDEIKAEVKKAFPNAKGMKYDGNDIFVSLPNGAKVRVKVKDKIIVNEKAKDSARQAHGVKDNQDVGIQGYWQKVSGQDIDGILAVSKDSEEGTTYHESLHMAMDLALTPQEKKALNDFYAKEAKEKGMDVEEAIANGYAKWRRNRENAKFKGVFKKLHDFWHRLKAVFTGIENAHNVMRKIESGEVWEREKSNGGTKDGVAFSVQSNNTAPSKSPSWLKRKWTGAKKKYHHEERVKQAIQKLTGLKVAWGKTDKDVIYDAEQGVIRTRVAQDWGRVVPQVAESIAAKMNVGVTKTNGKRTIDPAMRDYITDYILTGALTKANTQEAKDFEAAMKKKPSFAEDVILLQSEFARYNGLSQAEKAMEGIEMDTESPRSFGEEVSQLIAKVVDQYFPIYKMSMKLYSKTKEMGEKLPSWLNPNTIVRNVNGAQQQASLLIQLPQKRFSEKAAEDKQFIKEHIESVKEMIRREFPTVDTWLVDTFKPLELILQEAGVYGEEDMARKFSTYLVARRMRELHDRDGRTAEDFPTEYNTKGKCDAVIAELENPAFEQAAQDMYNLQRLGLMIQYDAGLVSRAYIDRVTRENLNYIPLQRIMDDTLWSDDGNSHKKQEGSARRVWAPLDHAMENIAGGFVKAQRNKAVAQLAQAARLLGQAQTIEVVENNKPQSRNVVSYLVNGERVYIEAHPELACALARVKEPAGASFYLPLVTMANRTSRELLTTHNPEFALTAFFRDAMNFFLYEGGDPIDWFKGIKHTVLRDAVFQEYMTSGASQSVLTAMDKDYFGRNVTGTSKDTFSGLKNTVKALGKASSFLTDIAEQSIRVAAYEKIKDRTLREELDNLKADLKKQGKTDAEIKQAIQQYGMKDALLTAYTEARLGARDLMDFGTRGEWGAKLNGYAWFANAIIQGGYKSVRALNWKDPANKGKVQSRLLKLAGICVLQALVSAAGEDDEDIKGLSDEDRYMYFHVKLGDRVWRLPKGDDLGIRTLTYWIDMMFNKRKATLARTMLPLENAMPSLIMPSIVKPAIEVWMNHSLFYNSEIVPKRLQNPALPEREHDAFTSRVAKGLGETFGWSPKKIDYMMNGYFGGLGRAARGAVDWAVDGKAPKEMVGVRRFLVPEGKASVLVNDAYEYITEQDALYKDWQDRRKHDSSAKPDERFDRAKYSRLKFEKKKMQELTKKIRENRENPRITEAQRDANHLAFTKARNKLAESIVFR